MLSLNRSLFVLALVVISIVASAAPNISQYGDPVTIDCPNRGEARASTTLLGINDSGVMVGSCNYYDLAIKVGFVYQDGIFTEVNPSETVTFTSVEGIANDGTLAGWYSDGSCTYCNHGFVFADGVYTDVAFPGAIGTMPLSISSDGRLVAGEYCSPAGCYWSFVLDRLTSIYTDISDSRHDTYCRGVSSKGEVTGYYRSHSNFVAFVYDLTSSKRKRYLAVDGSYAEFFGINDLGQVTGLSGPNAIVGTRGKWSIVTPPVPGYAIEGHGLNNAGVLVGSYGDSAGLHGFYALPK